MNAGGAVPWFLRLADLLPEPILLVTVGGEILGASRQAGEALGDLTDMRLTDLVDGDPQAVSDYLRLCARSRQLLPGSLTLARQAADGRREAITFHTEGALLQPRLDLQPALVLLRLNEKERALGRFLALNERIDQLGREIARRKRVEEELLHQREWLHVTLESIGDAVIATDSLGRVDFLNPAAQALTGWLEADARGRPLDEVFRIVNEETRRPVESPVERVLREGAKAGLANHTLLLSLDGREIPIDDSAAPIRSRDGTILGVVLVFHDVIERHRLERELRERAERLVEADRRKDEFLAMLAHELRNPLAPIRNSLYILGSPNAPPEMVERARVTMERQVTHLVRLVDDLLDVSRITRAKVELRRERGDLAVLGARVAEAVGPMMEQAGLAFSVRFASEPLPVDADPTRLEQVLTNLLHNALKFTEAGGRVELSIRRDRDEGVVSVRDTGIGVPPELITDLFEPFFQATSSLDRTKGGLGLGLTLVRRLVEMHGGRVEARSDGPGRGSEFTVRLPLAAG